MFARAYAEYFGVLFPGVDHLWRDRHSACVSRALVFRAYQARGSLTLAADRGISVLDCVFYLHALALVFQLIPEEMRCRKTTQLNSAVGSA